MINVYLWNDSHAGDIISMLPTIEHIIKTKNFNITLGLYSCYKYLYEHLNIPILTHDATNITEQSNLEYLCPEGYIPIHMWLGTLGNGTHHSYLNQNKIINIKLTANNLHEYCIEEDDSVLAFIDFPKITLPFNVENGIYIENSPCYSNDAKFNFDFITLSNSFPNFNFYTTGNPSFLAPNIINCESLNFIELSAVSNNCKAIVGKGSGPLVCTLTSKNINKPFAVMNQRVDPVWWPKPHNTIQHLNTADELMTFLNNIS